MWENLVGLNAHAFQQKITQINQVIKMKIEYRKGDLFQTEIKTIVHGCNAQGVMGSGVAKIIRDKYPKAYDRYVAEYKIYNHLKQYINGQVFGFVKIRNTSKVNFTAPALLNQTATGHCSKMPLGIQLDYRKIET